MGIFVRITLLVAAGLVALAALFFVFKLLVVAAVIAAVVVIGAFLVRTVTGGRFGRLGGGGRVDYLQHFDRLRNRWVTTLTARR